MMFWTCPHCGANLDHGEKCDCEGGRKHDTKNPVSKRRDKIHP